MQILVLTILSSQPRLRRIPVATRGNHLNFDKLLNGQMIDAKPSGETRLDAPIG